MEDSTARVFRVPLVARTLTVGVLGALTVSGLWNLRYGTLVPVQLVVLVVLAWFWKVALVDTPYTISVSSAGQVRLQAALRRSTVSVDEITRVDVTRLGRVFFWVGDTKIDSPVADGEGLARLLRELNPGAR